MRDGSEEPEMLAHSLASRQDDINPVMWIGQAGSPNAEIVIFGGRSTRRPLYSAATTLITQVRKPSPLRAWALRLQERKGFKKAAVAASRKLSVVMMCIWRDGTVFEPTGEAVV